MVKMINFTLCIFTPDLKKYPIAYYLSDTGR